MTMKIPISVSDDAPPFVTATAYWAGKGVATSVNFIVDTGAFDILLSMDTALKLGANLKDLKPSRLRVSGVGGSVTPYDMDGVALVFECDGHRTWDALIDRIKVMVPKRDRRGHEAAAPDLLGRAFMEEHAMALHWDFAKKEAYLEVP